MNGTYVILVVLLLLCIWQGAIYADNHERRLRRMEFRQETWDRVNELEMH
jgi:hypothetical protein